MIADGYEENVEESHEKDCEQDLYNLMRGHPTLLIASDEFEEEEDEDEVDLEDEPDALAEATLVDPVEDNIPPIENPTNPSWGSSSVTSTNLIGSSSAAPEWGSSLAAPSWGNTSTLSRSAQPS